MATDALFCVNVGNVDAAAVADLYCFFVDVSDQDECT